ncbi:MAG: hypothetical protein HYV07_01300 [Deltaproteobacteria bacterium]|nr:hypothetical protein [Deltaproteobacteria bacterium]
MDPPRRSRSRALLAVFTIALATSSLVAEVLPTHDGPHHIANCHIRNHLDDPTTGWGSYLRRGAPPTYLGFHTLCVPLDRALGWRWGSKLALFLTSLTIALGYAALSARLARNAPVRSVYGFALALPWALYMGFFDFVLASGLSLWVLAYAARPALNLSQKVLLALAVVIVSLVHVTSAAMLGIALALVAAFTAPRGRAARAILETALIGVPTLLHVYASVALYGDNPWPGTMPKNAENWHALPARISDLARTTAGLPTVLAALVLVPALLGLIQTLRWIPTAKALHSLDHESRATKALGVYGLLATITFLLCPFHLALPSAYWTFFSPRLTLLAALVLPLSAPTGRLSKWVDAAMILAPAAALAFAVHLHLELGKKIAPALAGLSAPIHRNGPRLPMLLERLESPIAHVEPLLNFGHYYLLDQGGVSPYLFAEWPVADPLLYTDRPKELFGAYPPRNLSRGFRCAEESPGCPPIADRLGWLSVWGREFQDVIIYPAAADVRETLDARGFVTELTEGQLLIARPGTCRVDVILKGPSSRALSAPVRIDLRRDSPSVRTRYLIVERGTEIPTEGLPVVITGPDCGELSIEVDPRCAEGERLRARAIPTRTASVSCTL